MTEQLVVCTVCGEGPNGFGCLVALHWSTDVGGYRWAHRVCAEREGLRQRVVERPPPRRAAARR